MFKLLLELVLVDCALANPAEARAATPATRAIAFMKRFSFCET
jgi:hypothetical protein